MICKTAEELIAKEYKDSPNTIKEAITKYPPNVYYTYQGFQVYIRNYRLPNFNNIPIELDDIIVGITKTTMSSNVSQETIDKVDYLKYYEIKIKDLKINEHGR